jgi:hypothetical protein
MAFPTQNKWRFLNPCNVWPAIRGAEIFLVVLNSIVNAVTKSKDGRTWIKQQSKILLRRCEFLTRHFETACCLACCASFSD